MSKENKILGTLHSQFADNQNHHQSIFIQFLIALFALFAGYGYVYTHSTPDIDYYQTSLTVIDEVKYFSLITLIITSTIVIGVLTLLNIIILNLGYGFRRDQHLNKIIRKKYLGEKEYEAVFGPLYDSDNKSSCNYLPNFYSIFFWFILILQIFILISTCSKEGILNCNGNYLPYIILLFDLLLILFSFCMYFITYNKYKLNIKQMSA